MPPQQIPTFHTPVTTTTTNAPREVVKGALSWPRDTPDLNEVS